MLSLIAEMAKDLLSVGIDGLRKKKEFGRLQAAVRERLCREIRFNIAMIDEAMNVKNDPDGTKRGALLGAMSSECFDEISGGGIPLDLFFVSSSLSTTVWPQGNGKEFTEADTSKYKVRIRGIKTQSNLLERLYHRIAVMKTLAKAGVEKGDVKYLRFLLRASEKSLARKEGG